MHDSAVSLLLLPIYDAIRKNNFWGHFETPPKEYEDQDCRCPECGCTKLLDFNVHPSDYVDKLKCKQCGHEGEGETFLIPEEELERVWDGPLTEDNERCPKCGSADLGNFGDIPTTPCNTCGHTFPWGEGKKVKVKLHCPSCDSERLNRHGTDAKCLDCNWEALASLAKKVEVA